MAYRCDQAVLGGMRDPIRCKVSGSVCAHQKMCLMEGRIVLTDGAMRCPARDGKMPEQAEREGDPSTPLRSAQDDVGKTKKPAAKAPAKKAETGKTGAAKKPAAKAPAKKATTKKV